MLILRLKIRTIRSSILQNARNSSGFSANLDSSLSEILSLQLEIPRAVRTNPGAQPRYIYWADWAKTLHMQITDTASHPTPDQLRMLQTPHPTE